MRRFALGLTVGALAYPVGLMLGAHLSRRNGVACDYAFGAR